MAKKKKVNASQLQKIEAAHQRNEFMVRFKQFCDKIDPVLFSLIPSAQLNDLYLFRNRPAKLSAATGQDFPPAVLKEAKGLLALVKGQAVQLKVGTVEEMSLYDFFTIGLTLLIYAGRVKDSDYPNASLVRLKLSPLAAFGETENYTKAWTNFYATISLIGIVMSDLKGELYALKHEVRDQVNGNAGMFSCLDMYGFKTEKIQVMIDGSNRPAFGLAMPNRETLQLDPVSIKPETLGLPSGDELPVYVQSHALDRLSERMDGVTRGFLHFAMYNSLKDSKVCKNKKGEWLFEFSLGGKKTGYFKADIIDRKIILRTFLFLTNNGTPEGEKLHEHTGIMKADKMYLAIDKFSGFMNSDIASNERVKEILIKAGCGSLFEIDQAFFLAQGSEQSLAGLIESYLRF